MLIQSLAQACLLPDLHTCPKHCRMHRHLLLLWSRSSLQSCLLSTQGRSAAERVCGARPEHAFRNKCRPCRCWGKPQL